MSYSIREAQIADADRVVELVVRLLSELDRVPVELDREASRQIYKELIGNPAHRAFIAWDGEKAVGLITVVQSLAIYARGRFGIINEFYVMPEYRSSGIGRLLLEEVEQFGLSRGW